MRMWELRRNGKVVGKWIYQQYDPIPPRLTAYESGSATLQLSSNFSMELTDLRVETIWGSTQVTRSSSGAEIRWRIPPSAEIASLNAVVMARRTYTPEIRRASSSDPFLWTDLAAAGGSPFVAADMINSARRSQQRSVSELRVGLLRVWLVNPAHPGLRDPDPVQSGFWAELLARLLPT